MSPPDVKEPLARASYPPPVRTSAPSGEKATALTSFACPSKRRAAFPVAPSQRCAVPSSDPARTFVPSGEKATEVTPSVRPSNGRTSLPVAVSHRRAVLSAAPVRT